jgi:hypothetical protein
VAARLGEADGGGVDEHILALDPHRIAGHARDALEEPLALQVRTDLAAVEGTRSWRRARPCACSSTASWYVGRLGVRLNKGADNRQRTEGAMSTCSCQRCRAPRRRRQDALHPATNRARRWTAIGARSWHPQLCLSDAVRSATCARPV